MRNVFSYNLAGQPERFNWAGQLGTERAVAMARKYGAGTSSAIADYPLALRAVYPTREHPNDEYVVYELDD